MLKDWFLGYVSLAFLALVAEAIVGYPAWLHAAIPHPVVWVGNAINAFERWWNEPRYSFAKRRALGAVAVLILTGLAVSLGMIIENGLVSIGSPLIVGQGPDVARHWSNYLLVLAISIVTVLVATVGLAQKSLFLHVKNVLIALRCADLPAARERVSMIVGRDTRRLDESGVSAAALESLAESFNDGIVAPAFWLAVGGLPGLFAYKVLNTADSLIGHKEERWRAFGWAAARADDVVNLIPARMAGILLAFAGWAGLFVMFKDASKHASPNAGWPEAAMAGALGVQLGGPTTYDGVLHDRPVFGTGPAPGVADLARGLRIYVIACGLLWLSLSAIVAMILVL